MAGVKAKRNGPLRKTEWHPSRCDSCGTMIDWLAGKDGARLYPAQRVQVISYDGLRGRRSYQWRHKACVK